MPDKLMVEKVARAIGAQSLDQLTYRPASEELDPQIIKSIATAAIEAIQSDTSVSEAMIEAGVGVLMSFPENTDLKDAVGPIYLAMRSISSEADQHGLHCNNYAQACRQCLDKFNEWKRSEAGQSLRS